MSYAAYMEGLDFIKRNSGTEAEEKDRLNWWRTYAWPLVHNKSLTSERASERYNTKVSS